MKLEIELVPLTTWYSNLRTKISQGEWDKIRKQSYSDSNHRCAICGALSKLNCHEKWEYDDDSHVQKLTGFIALCDSCHMIKHLGFAGIQADKGCLDMDGLIEHFMKVNRVDRVMFDRHCKESFRMWTERSNHEWKTDLSQWSSLLE